jgi:tetratricopeptide (TPR) repeat protein
MKARFLTCLLLSTALAVPAAAQVAASADTLADGSIVFRYDEEQRPELSEEDKIRELNAKVQANPADGKSWNDLGVIYAQREEFETARDAFIRAVQCDPANGDFHRNLGLTFSKLGMHEMAIAEFGQYRLNDQMGGTDYWRLIGGAQREAGMVAEARQTFREGLEAMPPDLGPEGFRLVLAWNRLEQEQEDEQAVRDLLEKYTPPALEYLRTHPEKEGEPPAEGLMEARAVVHNRVGMMVEDAKLMEQSGLDEEAARLYREAYEYAPARDDLLPRLVDVLIRQEKVLDAGVAARLARADHPDKAGTWIATAKVHERNRKYEEAVAAYEKAYGIEEMEDLRVAIGNLYMQLGDDRKAGEWLKAGVDSGSTKPEVVYNYAVSLIREKKYHAAIPSLRTVVSQRPDMVQGWIALAQCLQQTKQYSQAIEPYEKALELQPDPKLAFQLGSVAKNAGRYDKSVAAYQQALALDPTYASAQYNLALAYMKADRYEDAVAAFDTLVEMEGDTYRAYYSQGLSYYYLGDYDAALESYDMALEQKETKNVLNNIGLVYDKLGNKKEAAVWYEKAKQAGG